MRKLALIALAALLSCSRPAAPDAGPPAGPPRLAEQEPNDDPAHAQKLTGACTVSGNIAPTGKKGDEDWYRLDVPADQRATLTVELGPTVDATIEVFDQDGIRRLGQDEAGRGGTEVIRNLATGQPWLIRLAAKKPGESGAYRLALSLAPDDGTQELEPNNRAADATPLAMDKPLQGYLTSASDEDWYRLVLPAPDGGPDAGLALAAVSPPVNPPDAGSPPAARDGGGEDGGVGDAGPGDAGLADGGAADGGAPDAGVPAPPPPRVHLTLTGVPEVRLEIALVNAAEATLFSSRGRDPGDGIELRNLALRDGGGDFYVVVRSAWIGQGKDARRGASMDHPYTLTASLEAAQRGVEIEPNDDLAHATPLQPGGAAWGFISPKSDVDYFVLHSDAPSLLRAELSGVEHMDLQLSAVRPGATPDAKEQVMLTANDGEVKEPEVLTNLSFGPGDLYLKVSGAPRKVDGKWVLFYENAKDPYRLSTVVTPDDGTYEREPNNTPETATPIALGQSIKGTVHPKRDVDYYRLDLSAQPIKTQIHATCTGILKVDIALSLYRLDSDGSTTLVQASDHGKGDAPESIAYAAEPGVYLLKVQDAHNRESNFLDAYLLRVRGP